MLARARPLFALIDHRFNRTEEQLNQLVVHGRDEEGGRHVALIKTERKPPPGPRVELNSGSVSKLVFDDYGFTNQEKMWFGEFY